MRLLVVDHNAVDRSGRVLYELLARRWPGEITLLVPERWYDGYRMLRPPVQLRESVLRVHPTRILLPQRTHRMIYPNLARELFREQPEILYINAEPENFQTWHAAHLARQHPEMKFVFSSWRTIDHQAVGYPYQFQRLHRRAEHTVLARADHGIAFTERAREIFAAHGFDRMSYITPAVDTNMFVPGLGRQDRERFGLSTFTMGYVGRLVPEKGIAELLRASALCGFPHQVLIAGEGPQRAALQKLARELGIASRTVWTGGLAHSRIPEILNAMDVLILPSRTTTFWTEQFGRVLIEAMACRVPVVGSSSGAIPQVVGNAGVIVEEGNHHALAAAVTRLYDDASLRQDLADRGSQRVHQRYSLPTVAEAYQALFTSLMGSPHG